MWRSISTRRCYLTPHSWKTLINKVTSSSTSPSQVLHKTLYPSFLTYPFKSPHQNHIFMCHSSVIDFKTEPHVPTSSNEDLVLGNGTDCDVTHVGNSCVDVGVFPDSDSDSDEEDNEIRDKWWYGHEVDVVGRGKANKILKFFASGKHEPLEEKLDGMEFDIDEEFLMNVLKSDIATGDMLMRFFKWGLGKNHFVVTAPVLDAVTPVICDKPRRKNVYALWDIVKEIGDKENGIVTVTVLNQLLSACSKMEKGRVAFEVFNKFEEFGCVRNTDTYYLAIQALCKGGVHDCAVLVCQKMLDAGILPEINLICNIIMLLCKGRREKQAHLVYLRTKDEGTYPAQMAINLLISCLSKEDDTVHLAREMLADLTPDDRKFGIKLFSGVIRGLCRKKDTDGAKKLLVEMIENGPTPSNAVFNTVINSLSKAGVLDDAKEMMRLMESRGVKPDVYTYSVIMSGYVKRGDVEEAFKVYEEAKNKKCKLSPITFHTLIRGFCKLGELDMAVKVLSEMKDYGVDVVDDYNNMIHTLLQGFGLNK